MLLYSKKLIGTCLLPLGILPKLVTNPLGDGIFLIKNSSITKFVVRNSLASNLLACKLPFFSQEVTRSLAYAMG